MGDEKALVRTHPATQSSVSSVIRVTRSVAEFDEQDAAYTVTLNEPSDIGVPWMRWMQSPTEALRIASALGSVTPMTDVVVVVVVVNSGSAGVQFGEALRCPCSAFSAIATITAMTAAAIPPITIARFLVLGFPLAVSAAASTGDDSAAGSEWEAFCALMALRTARSRSMAHHGHADAVVGI